MEYIKSDQFQDICYECEFDIQEIQRKLLELNPTYQATPQRIKDRIANYRRRGLFPLDSGNKVGHGEVLKGTSTQYGPNGEIKQQWVKTDVEKTSFIEAFHATIEDLAKSIPAIPNIAAPVTTPDMESLATLYISNDVHFGALMWGEEADKDWNVDLARETMRNAYNHLVTASPPSKIGIVCDLGDLTEVDDFKNMTPKSGNVLDVDSRYPKILRAAYESLIYGIKLALTKHELVYFYNIAGNHDVSTGVAIREVIRMAFQDNERVIVHDKPNNIKYHQHGKVLLQFAHGDSMKMRQAGETMAHDCQDIFSTTTHRFAHFGHTHKDAVIDTPLCRAESHRNLAPLNTWAYNHGYRSGIGTMKSITYHSLLGETSRQIYNVN